MKWTQPGREKMVDCICGEKNRFYLWGAGQTGERFIKSFQDKINILGVIDSSITRQGERVGPYEVISPYEVNMSNDFKIIITINTPQYIFEVVQYLKRLGWRENIDFFRYLPVQRVLNYYIKGEMYIEQTDLSLTTRCTLRCKDCLLQMPFISNPMSLEWEKIKDRIDLSFKFVDRFGEYHLVGGEPTLSPELKRTIQYLDTNYGKRIEKLVMVTNATIEPTVELLKVLHDYSVRVEISDYSYSEEFCGRQKIGLWIEKLKGYNINYVIRVQEKWYQFGREEGENYCDKELETCFEYCDCALRTISFQNGRAYLCARVAVAEDSGLSEISKENSFLLGDRTEENRRRFLEYVIGYTNMGYIEQCRKCYQRKFFWDLEIPAAKQVER